MSAKNFTATETTRWDLLLSSVLQKYLSVSLYIFFAPNSSLSSKEVLIVVFLSEYVWSDRVMGSLIPQVIGPFIACDSTPAASHAVERHGVRTEKRDRELGACGSWWGSQ